MQSARTNTQAQCSRMRAQYVHTRHVTALTTPVAFLIDALAPTERPQVAPESNLGPSPSRHLHYMSLILEFES